MTTKANRNKHNRREFLYSQQKGRCAYCGQPIPKRAATLDHVVPKCRGGGATRENQVVACRRCNCAKGDKSAHILVAMLMQGLVA